MAKSWVISRDEAEYLVDVLESLTGNHAVGTHWRALYLATELRELFGMRAYEYGQPPRYPRLRAPEDEFDPTLPDNNK